jgi:hypothetical protein
VRTSSGRQARLTTSSQLLRSQVDYRVVSQVPEVLVEPSTTNVALEIRFWIQTSPPIDQIPLTDVAFAGGVFRATAATLSERRTES